MFGGGDGEAADLGVGVGDVPGPGCAVLDDEGDFPAGAGKVGVEFEGVAAVEAFADEDGLVEGELLACDDGAFRGVVGVNLGFGCKDGDGEEECAADEEEKSGEWSGHFRSALILRISWRMRVRISSSEGMPEVKAFLTWMGTPSSR